MNGKNWPPSEAEIRRRVRRMHQDSEDEVLIDLINTIDEASESAEEEPTPWYARFGKWLFGHIKDHPVGWLTLVVMILIAFFSS